jgi:hypothetical protein
MSDCEAQAYPSHRLWRINPVTSFSCARATDESIISPSPANIPETRAHLPDQPATSRISIPCRLRPSSSDSETMSYTGCFGLKCGMSLEECSRTAGLLFMRMHGLLVVTAEVAALQLALPFHFLAPSTC